MTTTTTSTRTSNNRQQSTQRYNRQQSSQRMAPSAHTMKGSNLTYIRNGNILNDQADTLLVAANTQGIMQAGFAGQVAKRNPEILKPYMQACQEEKFVPGSARRAPMSNGKQLILMGIWRLQQFASRVEWVENALDKLYRAATREQGALVLGEVATTKLGCFSSGNTSLDWEVVGPIMANYLDHLGVPVRIYVGADDPIFFSGTNEAGNPVITRIMPGDLPELDEEDDL